MMTKLALLFGNSSSQAIHLKIKTSTNQPTLQAQGVYKALTQQIERIQANSSPT